MSSGPRITNERIRYFVDKREPFRTYVYEKGNPPTYYARAEWIESGWHNDAIYVIYSFKTPVLLWYDGVWYEDKKYYSQTTDRLKRNCRIDERRHEMDVDRMNYLIHWGVKKYETKYIND